jgi:hypothetical protein
VDLGISIVFLAKRLQPAALGGLDFERNDEKGIDHKRDGYVSALHSVRLVWKHSDGMRGDVLHTQI